MDCRLNPVALAISTAFLTSTTAWAEGGASGSHGNIILPLSLPVSGGIAGTLGSYANGHNGLSFTTAETLTISIGVHGSSAGANGQNATNGNGGGGGGGGGGGSAFAAITQGGAGGATTGTSESANGGAGGNISQRTIENSSSGTLVFTGALGGSGGNAGVGTSGHGGGGIGGAGGASIFGGLSQGGAGGYSTSGSANGGLGGTINGISMTLGNVTLNGAGGGHGGQAGSPTSVDGSGAGGAGGAGGGSVLGGLSQGGAGGYSYNLNARGGDGGALSSISLTLSDLTLNGSGAAGGAGGHGSSGGQSAYGPGGTGGMGGGSVVGALSQGGTAGGTWMGASTAGRGGDISGVTLDLSRLNLTGAAGGAGGNASAGSIRAYGTGGAGGAGGGSVFGALSQGGTGGFTAATTAHGAVGGDISNIIITMSHVTLDGTLAVGGAGGKAGVSPLEGFGTGGMGSAGGGSVFGGFSQGGNGGAGANEAHGGRGGQVTGVTLTLDDVHLVGAAGGAGGSGGAGANASAGPVGPRGLDGGSIFGGYSAGGAGGHSANMTTVGGMGGDVSGNRIRLAGHSSVTGDIYGGYSRGGNKGSNPLDASALGGEAMNNHITLAGTQLDIAGSVWGGFSIDGDLDPSTTAYANLNNAETFTGNTLNLEGYRGSLKGIYNFEHYNWTLPADVVNQQVLLTVTGSDPVQMDNTKHSVAMVSTGNRLNAGDTVTLIDKVQGSPTYTTAQVNQGLFLTYDTTLSAASGALVLTIAGKTDSSLTSPAAPAGRINPTAKTFVEGRAAGSALINQGADLISENGIQAARTRTRSGDSGLFIASSGGNSRYHTGSHVDVRDASITLGLATALDFPGQSALTLGAFAEHGRSDFSTHNQFAGYGTVRGEGTTRYSGVGLLGHWDAKGRVASASGAGTDGLYANAVLRAGRVKTDFDSNLVDAKSLRGKYNSSSDYYSASATLGYALPLDEQQTLDLYSRYSWRINGGDKVTVANDTLQFGKTYSSRLRTGARYSYAITPRITPYVGLAVEREYRGNNSGSAFDMDIEQPTFKGNTAILELGVTSQPFASAEGWQLDAALQGFAGKRAGYTGSITLGYNF